MNVLENMEANGQLLELQIEEIIESYRKQRWTAIHQSCACAFEGLNNYCATVRRYFGERDKGSKARLAARRLQEEMDDIVNIHVDEPDGSFLHELRGMNQTLAEIVDEVRQLNTSRIAEHNAPPVALPPRPRFSRSAA